MKNSVSVFWRGNVMEQFSVTLSGLNQRIEEEQKIINGLTDAEDGIRSVRNALGFQVKSRSGIQSALKNLADQAEREASDLKTMRQVLKNIHDQYEKTERRICGYTNDHPISEEDIWNAVTTVGTGFVISASNPFVGAGWLIHEILKDEEWETEAKFGEGEFTLWDKWDEKKKDNKVKKHYEWESGKGFVEKTESASTATEAEKRKKELLDGITIWSGSLGKEGSLLHFGKDGDVETENGKYHYSADVMKAEAKGSLYAGLGGIGCEAGVALTAFTAKASGQLGNDMFNIHGEAQVDVGKVELSGEFKAGFVNEKGEFDPSLKGGFNAEAIAAEVSGKAGGTILGADVDVTGSINFGIGAHADIGYDNGKLSLDLGASLGLGGSVKLEIDMSGMVDAAVDCVSDIGTTATEVCKTVGETVEKAGDAIVDFTTGVADGIGEALGDAGDRLSKGWNTFKSWW